MPLTWRNFPGVVLAGHRAAEEGRGVADCPYRLDDPRHLAWVRGWLPRRREDCLDAEAAIA